MFRKLIIITVLGFLFGASAGGGYAYWRRLERGSVIPDVVATPGDVLTLQCSGGTSPRIRVAWDPKLTSAMGSLERSVDGGTWKKVFSGSVQPQKTGYQDTDVTLGHAYQYRMRIATNGPFTVVEIKADKDTCK